MEKMQETKKKQSAKQKRILIASLAVALILVIGSTFAWYTSKDSVTNRLTSSANYGVSITETFTPPDDWVPGQSISKKVGAVNTGNISAFVRLTLSNSLTVTYESATGESFNAADGVKLDTDKKIYATQAGGFLVSAPSGVALGKVSSKGYDTEKKPAKSGLYIYRRATDEDDSSTENSNTANKVKYTYDGFYYDNDSSSYYKIKVSCTAANEPDYGNDGNTVTDEYNGEGSQSSDGTADTSSQKSAVFDVMM